jgi:multidrug efflux pump subunit AcrA (membrane-fusion protein)
MRENVVTSESTSAENISEEAIREALSRILESAMFNLHAKEAALAVARVNLGYTRIASPGDGSVGERQVRFAGQSRISSGVGGAAAHHWTYPGGTSPVKTLLGTRLHGR